MSLGHHNEDLYVFLQKQFGRLLSIIVCFQHYTYSLTEERKLVYMPSSTTSWVSGKFCAK